MTTQTPTAPASEAGKKCECGAGEFHKPCKSFLEGHPHNPAWCFRKLNSNAERVCGHKQECHTPNRADPGP